MGALACCLAWWKWRDAGLVIHIGIRWEGRSVGVHNQSSARKRRDRWVSVRPWWKETISAAAAAAAVAAAAATYPGNAPSPGVPARSILEGHLGPFGHPSLCGLSCICARRITWHTAQTLIIPLLNMRWIKALFLLSGFFFLESSAQQFICWFYYEIPDKSVCPLAQFVPKT